MNYVSETDEALARLKTTAKNILRGRIRDLTPSDLTFAVRNLPLLARQVARYSLQHRAYNPPDSRIVLRVHCEQEPTSASTISLSEARDSMGLFRSRLNWQISAKELSTIRHYVETATRSLAGIARIYPDPDLMTGNSNFLTRCDDTNHHMGGMRMSTSASTGIVGLQPPPPTASTTPTSAAAQSFPPPASQTPPTHSSP